MKADSLQKLQQAAEDGACRLIYFDEAGFAASPPVQSGWSPIGEPHSVCPQSHCKRAVLEAFDYGANQLKHEAHTTTVKRSTVVQFLDQIAHTGTLGQPTIVVLDKETIDSEIAQLLSGYGSKFQINFS